MPRFYFDIRDCRGDHRDAAGEEFASVDEARDQCQAVLAHIAREDLPDGEDHTIACDVRDETGRVVYRGEVTYRGRFSSE